MEDPPARKPNQAARHRALRQQARASDPVAQAQVDALNARNRASADKARAEGRDYWAPEILAIRRAKKRAAVVLTPEQVQRARERQDRRAAAQRKREVAAAAPPKPVLSAEESAAQVKAWNSANNRGGYLAFKQRVAAGDPEAVAKYEQRLANNRRAHHQRALLRAGPPVT